MTPAQLDEARRWAALRGWRWMPGMRVGRECRHQPGHWIWTRIPEQWAQPADGNEWLPDTADPATRGCMLALLAACEDVGGEI